jgi:uncharacterized protein (DUF1015 family)
MPLVRPFRGLGYALDRYPDLTDLVCPPYDVITPAQQAELLARHERNAVRLELPPETDPYAAATATLAAWQNDGTLALLGEPSVYSYVHGTSRQPDHLVVHGVLARVLLEPLGSDVRAHEHTMSGPKADRLAHLKATRTQMSPILAVYFDRSAAPGPIGQEGADQWRARDGDAILHVLTATATAPDDRLLDYLSRQRLFLADGHHRYETALTYQAEIRSDPRWTDAPAGALAADWIMAVLVNGELEELEILPTHRLILGRDLESLRALVTDPGPLWQAIPTSISELAARLGESRGTAPAFGVILPGEAGFLLVGDADAIADRMRHEPGSPAVRGLDLAVLHATLLGDRLGIDEAKVAAGGWLAYTRSEADARAAVARGEAQAAILVRPTRLEQLAAVASAGDVMPQKSTYFYPKLLTGMVFNPLED